jgi:hypothetical protein
MGQKIDNNLTVRILKIIHSKNNNASLNDILASDASIDPDLLIYELSLMSKNSLVQDIGNRVFKITGNYSLQYDFDIKFWLQQNSYLKA